MESESNVNETLFPAGTEYKLLGGKTVRVKPWSIETIGLVSQRIPELIEKAAVLNPEQNIVDLIPEAADELAWLIAVSIPELTEEQVMELPADDVLGLTLVVYDTCVEGPLGKIAGLTRRVTQMMTVAGQKMPSSSPSSS